MLLLTPRQPIRSQIRLSAPSTRERMMRCSRTGMAVGRVRMRRFRRRGASAKARVRRVPGLLIMASACTTTSPTMKVKKDEREKVSRVSMPSRSACSALEEARPA